MKLLEGVKVIDFSKWLPGQFCGMLMGDYGADIIKVEDIAGDSTRNFFPAREKGMSYWHLMLNRNKRDIAINLKSAGGKTVLQDLLKDADVFLEGFRPGYLARYGLDYETIHKINPRLIYVSITGFGQKSHKPAHDLNVIGLAGLSSLDDGGSACVSEIQVSALGSSLNALASISMALFAREKSGVGQHLDISLYRTALSLQTTAISSLWGSEETKTLRFSRVTHYYNIYRTKDNRYLTVGTIEPKFWKRFLEIVDCTELTDRQFDFAHEKEFIALIQSKIQQKSLSEWIHIIGDEEICVTPVNTLEEALQSQLTESADVLHSVPSDIGNIRYIEGPVKFSESECEITRRAPKLGEHTREILTAKGYSIDSINKLISENAIK